MRGEVWLVDLDPTRGHEQAKKRPCLVVSATTYNKGPMNLAVVVPITSQARESSWFVEIDSKGGLSKRSYIMCNQVRTVSYDRFTGSALGSITHATLVQVEHRLRMLLNL